MPISEKIQQELMAMPLIEREKELMLALLEIEDAGNFRYVDDYERAIRAYVKDLMGGGDTI